jgi:hypothetical protein
MFCLCLCLCLGLCPCPYLGLGRDLVLGLSLSLFYYYLSWQDTILERMSTSKMASSSQQENWVFTPPPPEKCKDCLLGLFLGFCFVLHDEQKTYTCIVNRFPGFSLPPWKERSFGLDQQNVESKLRDDRTNCIWNNNIFIFG